MFFEVPLAIVVGIAAFQLAGKLSRAVFLAGHRTAGRLIESARWPLWGAAVFVAFGIFQRMPAGSLFWLALLSFGGGLAGRYTYVLSLATCRTIRILRARRNPPAP